MTGEELRRVIPDQEWFGGIEFSNERLEKGINYFNPWVMHDPVKDRKLERNKRKRLADMDPEELERELKERILQVRRSNYLKNLGMRDENGNYMKTDEEIRAEIKEYEAKYNPKPVDNDKIPVGIKGYIKHLERNHSSDSGIQDGIKLIDNEPVIPKSAYMKPNVSCSPIRTTVLLVS